MIILYHHCFLLILNLYLSHEIYLFINKVQFVYNKIIVIELAKMEELIKNKSWKKLQGVNKEQKEAIKRFSFRFRQKFSKFCLVLK